MNEPADDQHPEQLPRREAKVAGVRLVGIFVPWQAVVLTLAPVVV